MTALRDIQSALLHDIYSGGRDSVAYLGKGFAEHLNIYGNNTLFGLTDILANAYPVVKRIVGEEFFKTVARHYLTAHPQPSGNRHMFGGELSRFLKGFEPALSLPYLPDVAALEWVHFQASIADDAETLDFNMLASATGGDPSFVLGLHPSVHLVAQNYNALDIWREHQNEDPGTIRLIPEEHTLVIWRAADDSVLIRKASASFAKLIHNCLDGLSFAEAMMAAGESVADMTAFQQEFAEAVAHGVFSDKTEALP